MGSPFIDGKAKAWRVKRLKGLTASKWQSQEENSPSVAPKPQ